MHSLWKTTRECSICVASPGLASSTSSRTMNMYKSEAVPSMVINLWEETKRHTEEHSQSKGGDNVFPLHVFKSDMSLLIL